MFLLDGLSWSVSTSRFLPSWFFQHCGFCYSDTQRDSNNLLSLWLVPVSFVVVIIDDTYRDNTIENWGYEFVYIYVWTYVCHFVL